MRGAPARRNRRQPAVRIPHYPRWRTHRRRPRRGDAAGRRHMSKRALVTGGSGDIGAAICRQLAADGLHVIVHANANRARAEEVVAEIRAAGHSAEPIVFDVTDGARTRAAIETLLASAPVQVVV